MITPLNTDLLHLSGKTDTLQYDGGLLIYEISIRAIINLDATGKPISGTIETALLPPENLQAKWLNDGMPTRDGSDALKAALVEAAKDAINHDRNFGGIAIDKGFKKFSNLLKKKLGL